MRKTGLWMDRRTLLSAGTGAALVAALGGGAAILRAMEPDLAGLANMTGDAAPISREERLSRIMRAQMLMKQAGIGAVLIEPGASMIYFTGVRWSRSERLTAAILPVEGECCIVTPFFEEPSVRQSLAVPAEVRVWQEDESPIALVAGFLRDRKLTAYPIGVEETARFFISNGLAQALPDTRLVSANPVVRGCRMIKAAPEIALMQKASDVTVAAYRWTHARVEKGMSPGDVGALMTAAMRKLGGSPEFALVLIGEAAAYPHGSSAPQRVTPGEIVLMDCGCTVHGYQSDISRTFVHGTATIEQRRVWDQVARGQQIANAAAQIDTPAGKVDDAVRQQYEAWGYGPGYRLPGTSHRTGHGIGMDGHEPVNLVHGETTLLAEGMCFSNEPGIYLPGKFGVRLEDCFHMTASGPNWFSAPPTSIDAPMG